MQKIEVHLWSGLRHLVDGRDRVTVEARTTGELLRNLARDYPALAPTIDAGVSISIDGRFIANSHTVEITPANEIYLMQQLKGG